MSWIQFQTLLLLLGWSSGQFVMEELKTMALNGSEPYTEKSIDQILMQALGGYGMAFNLVTREDGLILSELDMLLTREQFTGLYEPPQLGSGHYRKKRKATRDVMLRWTNNELPYKYKGSDFSSLEKYNIESAMTEWEKYTCLNFRKSGTGDKNLVQFQNGNGGCSSQLGMEGGVQGLNLDSNGCRFRGLYLHEIGHAIGLVHEHQLPKRDDHIEIIWANVLQGFEFCFDKYRSDKVDTMGVQYEYSSIMHYGVTAFSGNNKPTIRSKVPNMDETIGRVYKKELGFSDVKIVNLMYQCSSHCDGSVKCTSPGFPDQNCRCICPDGTDSCTVGKSSRRDASCINSDDWQCNTWKDQGECERNPGFMINKCRKACEACGQAEPMSADCRDLFSSKKCLVWKDRGECVVNKKWMIKNCKQTCKACAGDTDDGSTGCNNVHNIQAECAKWAQEGECIANPVWMPFNCQKSCKMCDITPTLPPTTTMPPDDGTCTNEHNDVACDEWASQGECGKNPAWMIPNCRRACGRCSGVSCRNTWDDEECNRWAKDKECEKNRDWMENNCEAACNPDKCSSVTIPAVFTTRKTSPAGGITTPKSGDCVNFHKPTKQCEDWAGDNHCEINPWMTKNCAKSCNSCTGKVTTTTSRTTAAKITTTAPNVCKDLESLCPEWKKHGYCRDNPSIGLTVCRKSCGACLEKEEKCRDKNQLCNVWAKGGYCRSNPGFMLTDCRVSCDFC